MIPLDRIGFNWSSHKAALWWLGILYRRPMQFRDQVDRLDPVAVLRATALLILHALPWMILIRFILFALLSPHGLSLLLLGFGIGDLSQGMEYWIVLGVVGEQLMHAASALLVGAEFAILALLMLKALGVDQATSIGVSIGVGFGLVGGATGSVAGGFKSWALVGMNFGLTAVTVFWQVAQPRNATGVGALSWIVFTVLFWTEGKLRIGTAVAFAFGASLSITAMRLYYLPFGLPFVWPKVQPSWFRFHPVAWDDLCGIPFWRLDRLLVAYTESAPAAGMAEIERIATVNEVQRPAALRALATILARRSANAATLQKAVWFVNQLPQGDSAFLRETGLVREGLAEIVRLQNRVDTADRPMFRQPAAELLVKEIDNFRHRMLGLQEPLRTEFAAAAVKWLDMARSQQQEIERTLSKEPVRQVFRAGDPANRNTEAFVTRQGVIGQIEQQVMLSTGCPGIVLCGRRRRGKSTIITNLDGFLPGTVQVEWLSLQDPRAFTDIESLLSAIARKAGAPAAPAATLSRFFNALTARNAILTGEGRRLVLALDEYEQIDEKIRQGAFPVDLLDTLRESIQTHRAITWILAGSKEISELPNAPWSSYLVSARQIDVPAFTLAETRQLLTEPVRHSSLWPKDSPQRPHFAEAFWSPGGIERIFTETGGWPHLVQLVAESAVDLLNEGREREVTPELLEQAFQRSLERGHLVLYELMHRESFLDGEWTYLEGFTSRETQAPPERPDIARSLRRREIVTVDGSEWRLSIPLMRRWLIERGWR